MRFSHPSGISNSDHNEKKKNQRSFTLFYFYRFELKWECVLTRWLQEKKSIKRCSYGTDLRIRFKSVNITVTSSDGANCKICDVLLYPCFSKQWIVVIGTESTKGNANSKEFWQGVYLIYKGLSYARNLVRLKISSNLTRKRKLARRCKKIIWESMKWKLKSWLLRTADALASNEGKPS